MKNLIKSLGLFFFALSMILSFQNCSQSGYPSSSGGATSTVALSPETPLSTHNKIKVLRSYNTLIDRHLFSTLEVPNGWVTEDDPDNQIYLYETQKPDTSPVYRLYHEASANHYLTADENEKNVLLTLGWAFEHVDGYIYTSPNPEATEIFHLYNINTGDHMFFSNMASKDFVVNQFAGIWVQHQSLGYGLITP